MRYKINQKNGCWEWQRAKNKQGYGYLTKGEKLIRAHRYYYEKKFGKIPHDLQIDHLCRNKGCVNPRHLEAVSPAVNVQRGKRAKLTKNEVTRIRELYRKGNHNQIILSRMFGVSGVQVWRIVHRKNWK